MTLFKALIKVPGRVYAVFSLSAGLSLCDTPIDFGPEKRPQVCTAGLTARATNPRPATGRSMPQLSPSREILGFMTNRRLVKQQQKGLQMKRTKLGTILCAPALTVSAAFAQDQQPPPFSPVTGVTTTPGSATITTASRSDLSGSVTLKVDGSRVIDVTGQPLGRIENIVLSPVGCAEAAILTAANGRLIPIPWTLVRVSGDTRAAGTTPGGNLVFTVNLDQARLAAAPSFARAQWPDMNNVNWLQPSITFFGTGTAEVGATGAGGTVVTGGATNTTPPFGTTVTGGNATTRFGTTATGGTNQSRFGTTATSIPTNSTTVLPPTGRPNPGFNQTNTPPATPDIPPGPPDNRPPDNRPPSGVPPASPPPRTP
jgi:hypothetical protein